MAEKSMHTAATGMQALLDAMGVVSNNLANIHTAGFKVSRPEFADLLYQTMHAPGQKTSENGNDVVGQQIGTGVRLAGVTKLFSPGPSIKTGNDLDILISGPGFFPITNGDETLYTRDGHFKTDEQGRICTTDGYLFGALVIPSGYRNIRVGETGLVTYIDATGKEQEAGQLQITTFANPAGLSSLGNNMYRKTDASGEGITAAPGSEGAGTLLYQHIEGSNVVVVDEMVKMLSYQRGYELCSKALKTSSDMQHQLAQGIS